MAYRGGCYVPKERTGDKIGSKAKARKNCSLMLDTI